MNQLPLLKAANIIKSLSHIGFRIIRQKGSHVFLKHPDGRTTIIPNHPTEHLDRGLLNKIIKHDIKISREEFFKLL